jgi:hypothetical protein
MSKFRLPQLLHCKKHYDDLGLFGDAYIPMVINALECLIDLPYNVTNSYGLCSYANIPNLMLKRQDYCFYRARLACYYLLRGNIQGVGKIWVFPRVAHRWRYHVAVVFRERESRELYVFDPLLCPTSRSQLNLRSCIILKDEWINIWANRRWIRYTQSRVYSPAFRADMSTPNFDRYWSHCFIAITQAELQEILEQIIITP